MYYGNAPTFPKRSPTSSQAKGLLEAKSPYIVPEPATSPHWPRPHSSSATGTWTAAVISPILEASKLPGGALDGIKASPQGDLWYAAIRDSLTIWRCLCPRISMRSSISQSLEEWRASLQ